MIEVKSTTRIQEPVLGPDPQVCLRYNWPFEGCNPIRNRQYLTYSAVVVSLRLTRLMTTSGAIDAFTFIPFSSPTTPKLYRHTSIL